MSRLDLRDPAFVARSAPSGPILTVTSGLIARWEADSIVGLNDDDPIATWPDTSGSSRDATQATGSLKPLFKTNIFGTKPAVRFDGSNDKLAFTTVSIPNWTLFLVMKVVTWKGFGGVITWRGASQAGFVLWDTIANSSAWVPSIVRTNTSNAEVFSNFKNVANYIFPDTAGSGFPSAPGILMMRYDDSGPTLNCRKNSQAIAGTSTGGFTGVNSEGAIGIGYDYMATDIGAILVYDNALSDSDVNAVYTYLNSKFTVY